MRPMEQLDCNAAMTASGLATAAIATAKFKGPNGGPRATQALFANEAVTLKVKDLYGNITTLKMVAGSQIVGNFVAVWLTDDSTAITALPTANHVSVIF